MNRIWKKILGMGMLTGLMAALVIPGSVYSKEATRLVVVLDAGHGGKDSGAIYYSAKEKEMALKIAKYCKKELETYPGIKVYMTRNDDQFVELLDRTKIAADVKADSFVSIHINAAGEYNQKTSAAGVEVYYPNDNYDEKVGEVGKKIAREIQDNIVDLGMKDRGIKKLYSSDMTYEDGSKADAFSVIRTSKEYGFPGILVEHGFINNEHDNQLLTQEQFLQKLGKADADGIVSYYGLKRSGSGSWKENETGMWYAKADGSWFKDEWTRLGNAWYHFDPSGYANGGWYKEGGEWFFFDRSTKELKTGWYQDGSTWYYSDSRGKMVSNAWKGNYYLTGSGAMARNQWIGKYYVGSDGKWIEGKSYKTGFIQNSTGIWYQESDGSYPVSKWRSVEGFWYYFDQRGYAITDGWKWIQGAWYYFYKDGKMASKTWQGDYYLTESGAMATNRWIGDYYVNESGAYEHHGLKQASNGETYYFEANGIPAKGWKEISGVWYFFKAVGSDWGKLQYRGERHEIMGESTVNVGQMSAHFRKMGGIYPKDAIQTESNPKEAPTIDLFCKILMEEASKEHVRAEVVYAQAMMETGYLRFGGDVKPGQHNFAGIGAVGNGMEGNSFGTIREGIRAQVQHLKAYASKDPLEEEQIDPRFAMVERESAPYVEYLGIRENPRGKGWAASEKYGFSLAMIIEDLKKTSDFVSTWKWFDGNWYYFDEEGMAVSDRWKKIKGIWYYFYEDGKMAKNTWRGDYYLTDSGAMAKDTWIGEYYVDETGKWVPGKTR